MNTTVKKPTTTSSAYSSKQDIVLNKHKIQPYEPEYDFLPEDVQECGGLPNSIEIANACNAFKEH